MERACLHFCGVTEKPEEELVQRIYRMDTKYWATGNRLSGVLSSSAVSGNMDGHDIQITCGIGRRLLPDWGWTGKRDFNTVTAGNLGKQNFSGIVLEKSPVLVYDMIIGAKRKRKIIFWLINAQ